MKFIYNKKVHSCDNTAEYRIMKITECTFVYYVIKIKNRSSFRTRFYVYPDNFYLKILHGTD